MGLSKNWECQEAYQFLDASGAPNLVDIFALLKENYRCVVFYLDEDLVGISEYSKKRTIFGAPNPAKKTRHMIELMTTSEDQERG